ncbi:hypothetical protein LZ30DRAFT_596100 [Colletotrichum cereale]|nr:hypothetical protein LZ30DRAFT_596100 [Colletotrichum cereale]
MDVCIAGKDRTTKSGGLCKFSCRYGFCLESLCECTARGVAEGVPVERHVDVVARDDTDADLNHLCQFSCKYGHCPGEVCTIRVVGPDMSGPRDYPIDHRERVHKENERRCLIYKEPEHQRDQNRKCELVCSKELEEAKREGRTTNVFCLGVWPLDKPIPWQRLGPGQTVAPGTCQCDNQLVNEVADTVLDAAAAIVQSSGRPSISTAAKNGNYSY